MRTRRELLVGGAALGGSLLLPRASRAAVAAPEDRKFVFVWVHGGWDPTKVFMDSWAPSIVAGRTPGADGAGTSDERVQYGDLRLIANPARASVDRFFTDHHDRVAVVDGLLLRSINHPICRNLWMTNSANAARPDWPSTIGYAAAGRYPVPHIIESGFSMAGEYSAYTAYSGMGGSLQQLLDGSSNFAIRASEPHLPPEAGIEAAMDAFVARRGAARATAPTTPVEARLTEGFREAANRLVDFKDATAGLDMDAGNALTGQIQLATTLLAGDVTRCVTLMHGNFAWDTHTRNLDQDPLFDELFTNLDLLMRLLSATPGVRAPTLADETVVVVFSEMGRSPYLNSTGGKDHWMYTSCMMWGAGVRGGRQIGGYNDALNGLKISLSDGEVDATGKVGQPITPDVLGSTLLTLAGLDPAAELGADTSLRPLLA
ncbi:MAG: DUF1501 domain-containing protein [Alphaproteobacteria bacterium]|nr:DUF1501 domain-containing protein [Alphaproteobacteria bacterium]MCB9697435.1 DUF1501 domain-containing protein [Alphaproteobacteria bacterium]